MQFSVHICQPELTFRKFCRSLKHIFSSIFQHTVIDTVTLLLHRLTTRNTGPAAQMCMISLTRQILHVGINTRVKIVRACRAYVAMKVFLMPWKQYGKFLLLLHYFRFILVVHRGHTRKQRTVFVHRRREYLLRQSPTKGSTLHSL